MGKSLPSKGKLKDFGRFINSGKLRSPEPNKPVPVSNTRIEQSKEPQKPYQARTEQKRLNPEMEESSSENMKRGVPLAEVVNDCVKRWFGDTLKQAKSGDRTMQVIVGQMYTTGYGVPKDAAKGLEWIKRASPSRHSSWKVIGKQPGYLGSDSDSDENNEPGKSETEV